MAGSVTLRSGGNPAADALPGQRAVPAARRIRLDRGTTPGRLRMMLAFLVLASLVWGVLATFTTAQRASAAGNVVTATEPLSFDAQQIYRSLSDADDAAATAILAGGLEPQSIRNRYEADLATAKASVEDAAARGGPRQDLLTLSTGLTGYDEDVATALADNRLGFPLGAAYLRAAHELMVSQLIPAARDMDSKENAQLTAVSAQATGLPLLIVTVVAGLALGYAFYWSSRWVARRTHRVLNGGLLLAGAAGAVALVWLAVASLVGRGDLLTAQAQGSAPVTALAQADIAALAAHADESLTLINNSGDDSNQAAYLAEVRSLGPGPGTLLTRAADAAAGSPAAGDAAAAADAAPAWYAAHKAVRADDDAGNHLQAVNLVLSGAAGTAFGKFSADLSAGITAGNAAFDASARGGQGAFTGVEAGMVIAALVMMAGSAWGLSRRLAEYR